MYWKIEKGFMLLVGITQDDTLETIQKVAKNVQDFVYLKMKKENESFFRRCTGGYSFY